MGNITKATLIRFTTPVTAMPGKLTQLRNRWSQTRDNVTTEYCTNKSIGLATDFDLYDIFRSIEVVNPNRTVFIGKTKTGTIAELTDTATVTTQLVMVTEKKGQLKIAAAESTKEGVFSPYNADDSRKGSAIIMALFPYFYRDTEFQEKYDDTKAYIRTDPDDVWTEADIDDFSRNLCVLTNNMYYRTKNASLHGNFGVDFDENITALRYSDLQKNKVVVSVCGEPKFAQASTTNAVDGSNATSGKDLKGKYSILSHDLTEDEMKLVPTMAPWYITPVWVETEAKIIQASKIFPIPFRSLLLYGVSGTGKTEGAKAIFSALGLPAVSICCNVDMTMLDFMGQLLPNVNKYGAKSSEEVATSLHIPTYEDVENDFATTYKTLFGVEPDEYAAPADCYAKISEIMSKSCVNGEPDFIYVESEFVKAYRNGWGIEIQEPTIIKRNSVLAGLNKALDNDPDAASITLPTGEVVRRHPDTVVIMTTNQDYDGCNNIQQSVLSRMQNKRQIANPTTDELVERTVSETKFPDKRTLSKMATIIREINEYCNSADVTDGVCGPRELCNWAKRAYVDAVIDNNDPAIKKIDEQYVLRAAFPTIVEKVSQTSEDQEAVVIEVIQKHYAEGDVMTARDSYREGVA